MEPVKLNIAELRKKRQTDTNTQLVEALCSKNVERIMQLSNVKELQRYLSDMDMSMDEVLVRCADMQSDLLYVKTLAMLIAKKSSRQGDLDEAEQIRVCNSVATRYGITLSKLKKDEFRAMKKTPQIISMSEKKKMRSTCIDTLKSFDARISGEKEGWVFLKAVYGSGGHQDSVFREADEMCDWAKTHKKHWICVIIDTDQISKLEKLKNDYSDVESSFLFIGTSLDFQNLILGNLRFHQSSASPLTPSF